MREPNFFRLPLDNTRISAYLVCMAKFTDNNLATLRRKVALTQKALSELSGVPIRTIQDQEAGIFRTPNLDTARKLVRGLAAESGMVLTVDDVWPE